MVAIDLSHNRLGDRGTEYRFTPGGVSPEDRGRLSIQALTTMLLNVRHGCVVLRLGGNQLGDQFCRAVGDILAADQTIAVLDLSDNGITARGRDPREVPDRDEEGSEPGSSGVGGAATPGVHEGGGGVECLAEMVEVSVSLRDLNLSYNQIRGPGMVKFARSLRTSVCLATLDLSWCGLDSDTALDLAAALTENKAMRHLCLAHNRIQDRGAIALVQLARENHILETLLLDYNRVGQNGGAAIAHAISNPTRAARWKLTCRLSIEGCIFNAEPRRRTVAAEGLMPGQAATEIPATAAKRRLWYHFGVDRLTDKYLLDLSNPYERAIAVRMVEQAFLEVDDNWSDEKLNGSSWNLPEPPDPDQIWEVPWEGTLEFKYVQTKLDPASAEAGHLAATEDGVRGILQLVQERAASLGAPSGLEFL